jgi:hypothetical protein
MDRVTSLAPFFTNGSTHNGLKAKGNLAFPCIALRAFAGIRVPNWDQIADQ